MNNLELLNINYKKEYNNNCYSQISKITDLKNILPSPDFNLKEIINIDDDFKQKGSGILNNNNKVDFFIKYSPLLDPIKVLTHYYNEQKDPSFNFFTLNDIYKENIGKIENDMIYENTKDFDSKHSSIIHKMNYNMNCAFIDNLFCMLSSKLGEIHYFPNSIKTYDSFIGIKNNYICDIGDSVDCFDDEKDLYDLLENKYIDFIDNDLKNTFITNFNNNNTSYDSGNEKKKLNISNEEGEIDFDVINDNEIEIIELNNNNDVLDITDELSISSDITKTLSQNSSDSDSFNDSDSDLNYTDNEDDINNDYDGDNSDNDSGIEFDDDSNKSYIEEGSEYNSDSENTSSTDTDQSDDEPELNIIIKEMPVQCIIMENNTNTLDYLLDNKLINEDELKAALFQVIITLIIYRKAFNFTHNDLHTNNIMYQETDKQFIYYNYNNKYYKVPTFGKIYKIIDFGRGLFKLNDISFASDSFNKNEDADTQYNCEPFYDETKKRIDNNFSFDLCRLGCSLYDFLIDIDNEEHIIKDNELLKMIRNWCLDDMGKNVLYKSDGSLRYPDFKLYKMIARNVHYHEPEMELENDIFKEYIVSSKNINKKNKIVKVSNIKLEL